MEGIIIGIDFATLSPLQVHRLNEVGITEAEPYAIMDSAAVANVARVVSHTDTSKVVEVNANSIVLAGLQESWKESTLQRRLNSPPVYPTLPSMYYRVAEHVDGLKDKGMKQLIESFHKDIKDNDYDTEDVIIRLSAVLTNLANILLK